MTNRLETRGLYLMLVGLDLASGAALLRPGEVDDWRDEEAVAGVGDTGPRVVPGGKGGEDAEAAAGAESRDIDLTLRGVVQVGDTQGQEGGGQADEDGGEGHGGLERAAKQDESEDKPSLIAYQWKCGDWWRVELTKRNRPSESLNALGDSLLSMWKPPGVKMMANEIQNPP